MVLTDFAFSSVRQWMIGNSITAPSGMLVGTGSGAIGYGNTSLGSPLYPTWHGFDSRSGIGFTAEFEHTALSGDITTGSLVREIGMAATSGGTLWFRELMPEIELFGSTVINSFVVLAVK